MFFISFKQVYLINIAQGCEICIHFFADPDPSVFLNGDLDQLGLSSNQHDNWDPAHILDLVCFLNINKITNINNFHAFFFLLISHIAKELVVRIIQIVAA